MRNYQLCTLAKKDIIKASRKSNNLNLGQMILILDLKNTSFGSKNGSFGLENANFESKNAVFKF